MTKLTSEVYIQRRVVILPLLLNRWEFVLNIMNLMTNRHYIGCRI